MIDRFILAVCVLAVLVGVALSAAALYPNPQCVVISAKSDRLDRERDVGAHFRDLPWHRD